MKTYPIGESTETMYAFEVDNFRVGRRGAVRIVKTIPGVQIVRHPKRWFSWFREEGFCEFEVDSVRFEIAEPYGDNSRYWIGKSPTGGWCEQLEVVHKVNELKIRTYMTWTAIMIALAIFPMKSLGAEFETLTCNLFELSAELEGNEIVVSLQTDLPVNTSVMLSVRRGYQEEGSSEEYSGAYYSTKTIAGTLRKARRIIIDDHKWDAELKERQTQMARLGEGFSVTEISNYVEAGIVVPINQSDPRFGKGNKNLLGCGISSEGLRVIRRKVSFEVPYSGQTHEMSYSNLDPRNLDIGKTYIIEKKTPLLPEHSPKSPLASLEKLIYLPPGGRIKILSREAIKGSPWYWVSANSSQHGYIGKHWVNSTALIGQRLKIIEQ